MKVITHINKFPMIIKTLQYPWQCKTEDGYIYIFIIGNWPDSNSLSGIVINHIIEIDRGYGMNHKYTNLVPLPWSINGTYEFYEL